MLKKHSRFSPGDDQSPCRPLIPHIHAAVLTRRSAVFESRQASARKDHLRTLTNAILAYPSRPYGLAGPRARVGESVKNNGANKAPKLYRCLPRASSQLPVLRRSGRINIQNRV
jgi:hypothetical protein